MLQNNAQVLPDTPAIEIIVPSLVDRINSHLDQLAKAPLAVRLDWQGEKRLAPPPDADDQLLQAVRAKIAAGSGVPDKLLHSLEVAADVAVAARGVSPTEIGTVGASPAATAAWLGDPCHVEPAHRAVTYLEACSRLHDGPVPSVFPITVFERAWVLTSLASARIDVDVPIALLSSLQGALGPAGASGGQGLPPDADTTSATLHALALHGFHQPLDYLYPYRTQTHFATWVDERTASPTTNAHVLEAFTNHTRRLGPTPLHTSTIEAIATWLCDQQDPQLGLWMDKWHASPYYATAACALSLSAVPTSRSQMAVRRAVDWILASQRSDGSWGRWGGTAEETAYALNVLLIAGTGGPTARVASIHASAARGYEWLRDVVHDVGVTPPLWHDKDLYYPRAIVRAAVLGALHLAHQTPGVMAKVAHQ
jgi:hypothetical protein